MMSNFSGLHKYYINKQNIPNLKVFTHLLFLFYFFTGFNLVITFIRNRESDGIILQAVLLIGILFLILAPVAILDKRRENKSIIAVAASAIVHCLSTVLASWMFHFLLLYIFYLAELVICFFVFFVQRIKRRK